MIWLTSWFHQEIQSIPCIFLSILSTLVSGHKSQGQCCVLLPWGRVCNAFALSTGHDIIQDDTNQGNLENCGALHDIGRKFFISRIMKKDWVPVSSSYNNVSHLKLTLLFRIKRGARRYFVKETIDTSIWYEMNDLHIFAIYDKKIYVFQIRWKLLVILVKNRDESINIAVQCQNCMILNQTKSFIRARVV